MDPEPHRMGRHGIGSLWTEPRFLMALAMLRRANLGPCIQTRVSNIRTLWSLDLKILVLVARSWGPLVAWTLARTGSSIPGLGPGSRSWNPGINLCLPGARTLSRTCETSEPRFFITTKKGVGRVSKVSSFPLEYTYIHQLKAVILGRPPRKGKQNKSFCSLSFLCGGRGASRLQETWKEPPY